ncbi:MAG: cytochrome P450 [Actinomycetota bacterium]|jgi:cytochrome P450 family 142 subfamily A polypeptide 1|nr:cytochrome P450 [Actinomycetota bacterium]
MTRPPAELGIDLMSGAYFGGDPYPAFAWMREHEPVFYDEANELWALAAYRDVKAASTDTATFSSAGGIRPKFPPLPMMIDFDAPEHVRRRRLVSAGFTPRRVRELEHPVRRICDELLDCVCAQGSCDFVADVAAPLPLAVIGDMLGVDPCDRDDLLRWSDDMLSSQGVPTDEAIARAAEAFVEYSAYMEPVIEERLRSGSRDDLIGVLVNTEVDGDRLDHDSLVHETLLILVGGDETTRHVLSGGMEALLAHPDQLERLRQDRSLLPGAVEEMLRWVSPIKNMARTVTTDVQMRGRELHQGDEVLLLYPSANRDAEIFSQPDRFDIARNPNPHLAFGFGAHVCLGNQLARLELRVMVDRILTRLPDLELAADGPLRYRHSNFITGLESMPVRFTPTPP